MRRLPIVLASALVLAAACRSEERTGPISELQPIVLPDGDGPPADNPLRSRFGSWRVESVEGAGLAGLVLGVPAKRLTLRLSEDRLELDEGRRAPPPAGPPDSVEGARALFDASADRLAGKGGKGSRSPGSPGAPGGADDPRSRYRVVGVQGEVVTVALADRVVRLEPRAGDRLALVDPKDGVTLVLTRGIANAR